MPDISIDWLTISAYKKCVDDVGQNNALIDSKIYFEIMNLTEKLGFEWVRKNGDRHYEYSIMTTGFRIYLNDDENRCNIQIHGQGCSIIDENYEGGLKKFILDTKKDVIHYNRLDLASDDFEGLLDISKIENCYRKGLWRGSARDIKPYIPRDSNGDLKSGATFYIGDRKSDAFIRIYDKKVQMNSDKKHWVRCELELKGRYAGDVLGSIISDNFLYIDKLFNSICYDRIRFLTHKDSNNHVAYDKHCRWWSKFLDGTKCGLKLTRDDEKSLYKSEKWVLDSVAPTLGMLYQAKGADFIIQVAEHGFNRITKRQQQILKEYENEMRELCESEGYK